MNEGKFEPTRQGTVQGSPLSPLLSNIVLDELDKELENRGLEFCRYADDANVYVGSENAAKRVLVSITRFIENRLKLKVNQEKSQTNFVSKVKFLGITILAGGAILISKQSMAQAYDKVRELTPRGCNLPVEKQLEKITQWHRGWTNYYGMTSEPKQIRNIEARIRRRVRARLVKDLKRRRHLVRRLVKLGAGKKSTVSKTVYSNKGPWALSRTRVAHKAWSNKWFERMGFESLTS